MPLHDYRCLADGTQLRDQYRPITEGARANPPLCPTCHAPMDWVPQIGRMDAYEPFQEIEVYDNRNKRVMVDSLRKIRHMELESEKMARDGIGAPMRWRDYTQDRSNSDVHTIMPDPTPEIKPRTARGVSITRRSGDAVTADHGTIDE